MATQRHEQAREAGGAQYITHDSGDGPRVQFNPKARPIEREKQLEAFVHFLEGLSSQQKGTFAVAGHKGTGRTFFMRHAAQLAQDHHYLVLPMMPGSGNQPYPLGSSTFLEALQNEMDASGKRGLLIFCDDAEDLGRTPSPTCKA